MRDAVHLYDPTLITDPKIFDEIANESKRNDKNYMVAYILDMTTEKENALKHIAKLLGKELKVIPRMCYNKKPTKIMTDAFIPVEDFVYLLKNADFIVSDSFHGMCFAIIFNKPFICISNKSRGAARFESICEMLGIENQCINSIDEIYERDCVFKINYDLVNKRIEEERRRGLEFLNKSLDAPCGKFEEKQAVRTQYLEDRVSELESQANLKYQIKKELWNLWLVIFHKYLPQSVKIMIRFVRDKYVRK